MRLAAWLLLFVPLGACSADSGDSGGEGGAPSAAVGAGSAGDGGAAASAGPGGHGGDETGAPLGSWRRPIAVVRLPFAHARDTSTAPADDADAYGCASALDADGGEVVYAVTIDRPGWLAVSLDVAAPVDVDAQLLAAAEPAACLEHGDDGLGFPVVPGSYWLAIDGPASSAGAYQLALELVSEAGDDCYAAPIACAGDHYPLANGVAAESAGDAGCPNGMARIEAFCVDRYEAALALRLDDGALAPWSPYQNPAGAEVVALSAPGLVPQAYLSHDDAEAACLAAGKRLCSDSEWLRACRGPDDSVYPYGDEREPGRCNDARECHPAIQYFETDASFIWGELDHPCLDQLPEGLAPTGWYNGCASAEGVFDLMGNLHEWTEDPSGTFRGGFFVDTTVNGDGCLYATTAHAASYWDYSTGFRCCADAQ